MTDKDKLKKLLQIAIDNGYKAHEDISKVWINRGSDKLFMLQELLIFHYPNRSYSVNDIVLNWGSDISFLDALFTAAKIKTPVVREKAAYFFRQEWVDKPTDKRLDFLFIEFSHLLN